MELREYVKIIRRYWFVFWGAIIIVALASFLYTKLQPKSYLASTTLTVNKASAIKQSQANYYLFDNYYNVQSSALFSQIVVSWFSSPAVVKAIYEKAHVPLPDISQSNLAKTFKANREEPSTIKVSLVGVNKDETTNLMNAAADVIQENTNELGRQDKENVYDIVKFSPLVSDNSSNLVLNTIIGLIIGIIFGVILAIAIDYFRAASEKPNSFRKEA